MLLKKLSAEWRPVFTNTAWLFSDRVVRLAAGLFVGIWVARYLGPAQFGSYNHALAWVALFGVLAGLGLDSLVVRNLVTTPAERHLWLGTASGLKLCGSIAMLVGLNVSVSLTDSSAIVRLLVAISSTGLVFQAFDTVDFWFQSQMQAKLTVYARNSAFALATLLKVLCIQWGAPLQAFAWIATAELATAAVGLFVCYVLSGQDPRAWRFSINHALNLLRESWPLMLSGFAITIYTRVDQVMLGSTAEAGTYAAAVRISEVWYMVPVVIANSTFPLIVQSRQIDEALYYRRLQAFFDAMAGLSYLVAIPVTLLSNTLVTLLYGNEYEAAGPVLALHVWTGIFVALGVARSMLTTAEGLTRFAFLATLLGAITNVLLNIFLIPRYGALGAAFATLVSQFMATTLSNMLYARTRLILVMQLKSILLLRFFRLYSRKSS
jgi:PST family polysaccharide transporter